ncbi:hypothetical protein L484_004183 [Morus notabilis]|uniref:Uncharacterized protein n=1 Tax=Morus notabilis TaxID=981085 RepID=W9RFM9_9ROSA|nr:hypothetical protein L484_004183 [Morus notabilis]
MYTSVLGSNFPAFYLSMCARHPYMRMCLKLARVLVGSIAATSVKRSRLQESLVSRSEKSSEVDSEVESTSEDHKYIGEDHLMDDKNLSSTITPDEINQLWEKYNIPEEFEI